MARKLTGNAMIRAAMLANERRVMSHARKVNKAGFLFWDYDRKAMERLVAKGRLKYLPVTDKRFRYGGYAIPGMKVNRQRSGTDFYDMMRFRMA